MSQTFTFSIGDKNVTELLNKAIKVAGDEGIKFTASSDEGKYVYGTFSGKGLEGSYITNRDNSISVTVDKKPFIIHWGYVEKKLKEFFNV